MPHIHEKIDYTASAAIVSKGKVLIRKHDKYDIWIFVGGHIELDEDPVQAVVREAKEEVGLDIAIWGAPVYKGTLPAEHKDMITPSAMNRHPIKGDHEHIDLLYYAKSDSDAVKPEAETDVWKWCTKDQVDSLPGIMGFIAFHAKRAIELLSQ